MEELRIGTLGAARITPMALIRPARAVGGVRVEAVAARDRERAQRFARKHGLARVHDDYAALLEDPEIDAVYIPLPNSHHAEWTVRALEAGKHVLCEKPFTANAAEAQEVARTAAAGDRVLMEAFHWRYHPLAARMLDVIASGVLGEISHVETHICFPLVVPGDIRYRLELAGGATMDAGCYAIHMLRTLAGAEPEVVAAEARLSSPGVDRWMTAGMRFSDGRTGRITCSLFSSTLLRVAARVVGSEGEMSVLNPVAPHLFHRLRVRSGGRTSSERVPGESTYTHQLRAFLAAVREGTPTLTPPAESIANMRVIDAVYERAGLPLRGTAT